MAQDQSENNRRITETIGRRVRAGADPTVAGWQAMLTDLLQQMSPYMAAGHLVTFQTLKSAEKDFFRSLNATVRIPEAVAALYLPPSVRHQMLYGDPTRQAALMDNADPDHPPDAGILLGRRTSDCDVIVNALFAYPPYTPAVDVYDRGQLIAGYTYHQIEQCRQALSELLRVHLSPATT
jgi:hypothetical protein